MGGIYWLASYPKSGNTWFRSFLYNLQKDGDVPADINELSTGPIASGRDWLDQVLGFDTAELDADEIDRLRPAVYKWSLQNEVIGYHKIHDAYTQTADGEPLVSNEGTLGALYIVRNPLDVASSLSNHNHISLEDAIKAMNNPDYAIARSTRSLLDQVQQKQLTWSQHVLSWADAPGLNRLVIRYEDMLTEPVQTFTQAAKFLQLPTEPERIAKAIRFSDFEVLSKQEAENGFRERPVKSERFFRGGKSGSWREHLNSDQVERIVGTHKAVMVRFNYLDDRGRPF